MELWVRSQDKRELVKTNDIYIVRKDKYFHIYCYANDGEIDLGQYGYFEDKTRALEVLDEIQNIIKIKFALQCDKENAFNGIPEKDINYLLHQCAVYEMPQD